MGNQAGREEEAETGVQGLKKSGVPSPRDVSSPTARERSSLREPVKTSSTKRMVSSASTSSLSTMTKQMRSSRGPQPGGPEKGLLETRVKELLDEAKLKDAEISNLKMELHGYKEKEAPPTPSSPHAGDEGEVQVEEALVLVGELRDKNAKFQRELAALREENQGLKEKLLSLELLSPSTVTLSSPLDTPQDGPPPKTSDLATSVSSSPDVPQASPSPESSVVQKVPSCSSVCSSTSGDASCAVEQDVSQQVQQMEEKHRRTSEDLQVALQKLSDHQQMVQQLMAQNELLQESVKQQREDVEMLTQNNELLKSRLQEEVPEAGPGPEWDQKFTALVEESRVEQEKLMNIQQQLTSNLQALEKERDEAQSQILHLQEEVEKLQAELEMEQEASGRAGRTVEEHRASEELLRAENSRLRAQAEDASELQARLETVVTEKDSLEVEVEDLRLRLLQSQAENQQVQAAMSEVEEKHQQIQAQAEAREQELLLRVSSLEQTLIPTDKQVNEMKETIFELEDQVEQQRAVNLHTNQNVIDLENLVKRLEEQKADAERKLKLFSCQMKEEKEDWRRFQADLQTAVVVANDIKVEAQQELLLLRRQLQEEQDLRAKLTSDLQTLQGLRLQSATFDTKTAVEGH